MIETRQSVLVSAPIDASWDYARDVERWAEIMPGYQSCEILSDDDSLWTLKVGVGGLVRTVKVAVHVDRWAGPERVEFSFKLQGDPVEGSGTYDAVPEPDAFTRIDLSVQVRGSGPMAPMWEAMGGPVLPKFAQGFARELKGRIEAQAGTIPATASAESVRMPQGSALRRVWEWLRSLFTG